MYTSAWKFWKQVNIHKKYTLKSCTRLSVVEYQFEIHEGNNWYKIVLYIIIANCEESTATESSNPTVCIMAAIRDKPTRTASA